MAPITQLQPEPTRLAFSEALQVREEADRLLDQLVRDRDLSERRGTERGQSDPLKTVTGRSALDNAVRTTEVIIHRLDRLTGPRGSGGPRRP